jgi:hypothetical protein
MDLELSPSAPAKNAWPPHHQTLTWQSSPLRKGPAIYRWLVYMHGRRKPSKDRDQSPQAEFAVKLGLPVCRGGPRHSAPRLGCRPTVNPPLNVLLGKPAPRQKLEAALTLLDMKQNRKI